VLSGDDPGPHDIQGIGAGFKPAVLELERLDGILRVSEREALEVARRCARGEGLPIGISSGAALAAAIEVARDKAMEGRLIVAIAPSFAERYLSTRLFAGL
jgi:cysteine synthase A